MIGAAVFYRVDERMQNTINGLSRNGYALPGRVVTVAACGFIQAETGQAVGRVLAMTHGRARRVVTERLTMLKRSAHFPV